jgi:hypothetical protein
MMQLVLTNCMKLFCRRNKTYTSRKSTPLRRYHFLCIYVKCIKTKPDLKQNDEISFSICFEFILL